MAVWVAGVGAALAAGYVGMALLVFLRQSSYVYYPTQDVVVTPRAVHLAFEEVELATADGETIRGWFIPGRQPGAPAPAEDAPPAPVVLVCHGNGGNRGDCIDMVRILHNMRADVFIFDYRGYGGSSGRPSEAGTYEDAMTAWRYLTSARRVPPERIVLYGRSLGGAVAAWLAERVGAAGLVMESTFTSAPDMGRQMFPWFPLRWLCRYRYDTLSRMAGIRAPVLIAHSPGDEMVPGAHGRRLYEAARPPRAFVELRGGHNTGGLEADAALQRELKAFIDRHARAPAREQ